jgi:hypothetical protein
MTGAGPTTRRSESRCRPGRSTAGRPAVRERGPQRTEARRRRAPSARGSRRRTGPGRRWVAQSSSSGVDPLIGCCEADLHPGCPHRPPTARVLRAGWPTTSGHTMSDWAIQAIAGRCDAGGPWRRLHRFRASASRRPSAAPGCWEAWRLALGARRGAARANVAEDPRNSSVLKVGERHLRAVPDSRTVAVENVRMERLDDLWPHVAAGARHPCLKIDTQGYELIPGRARLRAGRLRGRARRPGHGRDAPGRRDLRAAGPLLTAAPRAT